MLATPALHLSGHRRRQIAHRPGSSLRVGRVTLGNKRQVPFSLNFKPFTDVNKFLL